VVAHVKAQVHDALEQLRGTSASELLQPRAVGRAALPTNTLGLLFHAAEHCNRHAGQAISTARMLMER
jgi:hypothetical protein